MRNEWYVRRFSKPAAVRGGIGVFGAKCDVVVYWQSLHDAEKCSFAVRYRMAFVVNVARLHHN